MGLLMHYVVAFCQQTEIEFGDSFLMKQGGIEEPFLFNILN